MFKVFIAVATLAVGLVSTQVSAAFTPTDWKVEGDGLAVLHQDTGLEWLSLTKTKNKSINEIKALLGTTYEGWRLPSYAEMQTLAQSLFPVISNEPDGSYRHAQGSEKWRETHSRFGVTVGSNDTWGLYERNDSAYVLSSKSDNTFSFNVLFGNLNYKAVGIAVYLVSSGGTTLSSQLNPEINTPGYSVTPSDVSGAAFFPVVFFMVAILFSRRNVRGRR